MLAPIPAPNGIAIGRRSAPIVAPTRTLGLWERRRADTDGTTTAAPE